MEEKTCKTCAHFVRHYRKAKRGYWPVAWGHCTQPMVKPRYDETPACEHYREASPTV